MFVSDHPHAKFLKELYETEPETVFARLQEVTDPSFVVHCSGEPPIGGDFVGLEEFGNHLGDYARLSGGTSELTQQAYYADDTWGLVSQTVTGSREGRSLDMPGVGIWRFSGPNVLAEHWEIPADVAEWNRFWGE